MNRLFIAAIAFAFVARLDAGLTYRTETTTVGVRSRVFNGIVKSEAGHSRFEVTRSDETLFGNGCVILSSANDSSMTVLNPATKTYSVIDFARLASSVVATQKQLAPWMSIAQPVVTVKSEGPGGMVEGYPTRRWVIDATIAMRTPAQMNVTSRLEIWATDKLPSIAPAIAPGSNSAGDPIFGSLREAEAKIKGFPLKSVTVTKMTSGGSTTTTTSRMKVTAIHVTTVPQTNFVIPADYRKVESPIDTMLGTMAH